MFYDEESQYYCTDFCDPHRCPDGEVCALMDVRHDPPPSPPRAICLEEDPCSGTCAETQVCLSAVVVSAVSSALRLSETVRTAHAAAPLCVRARSIASCAFVYRELGSGFMLFAIRLVRKHAGLPREVIGASGVSRCDGRSSTLL